MVLFNIPLGPKVLKILFAPFWGLWGEKGLAREPGEP